MHHVHVSDRAALAEATELIAVFGELAVVEAALLPPAASFGRTTSEGRPDAMPAITGRIGEGPYMGLFSLASIGGLVWLFTLVLDRRAAGGQRQRRRSKGQ